MNKDNKINLFWAMVCGSSSVDQNTNNMSMFNVFEEITINNIAAQVSQNQKPAEPGQPTNVLFPHEVITVWSRTNLEQETKAEMKVEFIDPFGNILSNVNPAIIFEKGKQRMRIILKINGLQVTIPGEYKYVISLKTASDKSLKEIANLPIVVKMAL